MDPLVFGLVMVAAVLHVTWNVLLKTAGDPLRAATVGAVVAMLAIVPIAAIGWVLAGRPEIPVRVLPLTVASGILEATYFVLLSAAYRRGDLSVVYPIARGTAPLLAVGAGVLLLGERLGPVGTAGVAALLAGILALQRPWEAARRLRAGARTRHDSATAFALLTGVAIASYSAVDRVGTRLVEPWLYGAILWICTAAALVTWYRLVGARATGNGTEASLTPDRGRGVAGGILMMAQYQLILFAYSLAPLTAVAPLRESAVLLATGWGALRLGEAAGRRDAAARIGAASVVVAGAVLLALER